ncbi:hypothetical protein EJB05_45942, partial [Eragrostis curvula]
MHALFNLAVAGIRFGADGVQQRWQQPASSHSGSATRLVALGWQRHEADHCRFAAPEPVEIVLWKVPNPVLRDILRKTLSKNVMPAYRRVEDEDITMVSCRRSPEFGDTLGKQSYYITLVKQHVVSGNRDRAVTTSVSLAEFKLFLYTRAGYLHVSVGLARKKQCHTIGRMSAPNKTRERKKKRKICSTLVMVVDGWSSLPVDLLQEVSGRLSSDADLLHIHQVCAHWRAFTVPPAIYRPWLVAGRACRSGLLPIGEYSLRLPRRDAQRMDVGAPPAGLPYCCGASRGWLALVDDDQSPTRLVLWEPLSNTDISLPCLTPLTRIFLSDDPLTSSDWVAIAGQLIGIIGQRTLLWRPGDADWTMLNERGTSEIDTIAFLDGKAYYIDIRRNIIICDLNTGTASVIGFMPCAESTWLPAMASSCLCYFTGKKVARRWLKCTSQCGRLTDAWISTRG